MNGRIYDPLLGRFLSADLVVQSPGNLQCFNRYSYVLNNPLTLTDPSGFYFMQMMPDWAQKVVTVATYGAVPIADNIVDVNIEGYSVYSSLRSGGDNMAVSAVTATGVGISRLTGAMDLEEAREHQKIVLDPKGGVSVQEITDPNEIVAKAVHGAVGMVLTAVGGAKFLAPEARLSEVAPKPEPAPEVSPTKAPSTELKEVTVDASRHPETAQHVTDAQAAGHPDVVTVDRPGAPANRQAATGNVQKVPGKQLDEYPPAMFKEGGKGASVRPITPKDNMGAGASMGNQLRDVPNGTKVRIKVIKIIDGKPTEVNE
jgi:hypothetical protein